MHAADSYSFASDKGNPSRLIANSFLGYRRDWSKDNRPGFGGGGAWFLDRFWGYNYVDRFNVSPNDAITHVHTVNGRLFAYIRVGEIYRKTVELTDVGVREVSGSGPKVFGWDKSFNRISVNPPNKVVMEEFLGLNVNQEPQWSAPRDIARFDPSQPHDPFPTPGNTPSSTEYPILDGRVITTYQVNDGDLNRYHIGALNPDGSWQWRHGKPLLASIPFPTNGWTTIHGNAYAVGGLWAVGEFAVLSWNGEFFDGGQAGKHLIYSKDGLYVGQIGQSSFPTSTASYIPLLGANGNALHGALLFADGKYRYLHSTESQSSGILEWTFENMESYGVLSGHGSFGSVVDLGTIPEQGEEPAPPGDVTFVDEFDRIDSTEVGNGWHKLSGGVKIGITDKSLVAEPGIIRRIFENIVYRNVYTSDSCQIIYVPESFFPPQAFGLTNANGFMSEFGVVARLQPGLQTMIIAFVRYDRSPTGADGNGSIGLELLAAVNGRRFSLGKLRAKYLPDTPGSKYQLRLVVVGELPTRVEAMLLDDSQGKEILRAYTELWEPELSQGGFGGISIGVQGVRVDRYEDRQFSWPVR